MAHSRHHRTTSAYHLSGKMAIACIGLLWGIAHAQTLSDGNHDLYVAEGTELYIAQGQADQPAPEAGSAAPKKAAPSKAGHNRAARPLQRRVAAVPARKIEVHCRPYNDTTLSPGGRASGPAGILAQGNDRPKAPAALPQSTMQGWQWAARDTMTQMSLYTTSGKVRETFTTGRCRPPPRPS